MFHFITLLFTLSNFISLFLSFKSLFPVVCQQDRSLFILARHYIIKRSTVESGEDSAR